jgi:AcrR family transcriptional regulator
LRKRAGIVIALDHLCATRDFDDIAVQDLCEESGLSRSTFYRAFPSKFEVCAWYQDILLEQSLGQVGRTLGWADGFTAFHSGWLLFPHMNLAAKRHTGLESIEARWPLKVTELLLETLTSYKGVDIDESLLFQVHFLATTTRPQGRTPSTPWTDDLYDCTPETYGKIMATCVPHDLHRLLNEPDRPSTGRPERSTNLTISTLFSFGRSSPAKD